MKERNYLILALIRANKRTSIHGKSNKAKRRKDKVLLTKEYDWITDMFSAVASQTFGMRLDSTAEVDVG